MSSLALSVIGGFVLIIPTVLFLYVMIQLLFRVLRDDIIFSKEFIRLLVVYGIIFSICFVGAYIVYICN
nr:MAG TPA: hypothetical protein [Bacteriophage sp.]